MVSVCHIIGGIVGGGVEQVIANYCSRIEGVRFTLLYQYEPEKKCLAKLEKAGVSCIRMPDKKKHPVKHWLAIYSFLKKNENDAIHVHLDWFQSWIICLIAYFAGIKKRIIHHHQVYQEKTFVHKIAFAAMQRMNLLCSTHRLACSSDAAINGFGKKAFNCNLVTIIQNAIDVNYFRFNSNKRKDVRQKFGLNEKICIGCVGRLCEQKNQLFLLSVFKLICEKRKNVLLMLIGDGPNKSSLRKLTRKYNIEKNVIFIEPQEDLSAFYSSMDIFCLPSKWEGLGMVLIEAQINGLHCVASDRVPRVAKISKEVMFLPIKDEHVWANAILNSEYSHNNVADSELFNIDDRYKDLEKIYLE